MTHMLAAGQGRSHPSIVSYLLPRLRDILFIALFLGVVGLGPRLLNVDGDLGRHLTIGAYILENRVIPTRDIFSHTLAGAPLTPHEWLAEVFYALAYRLAGLNGVVLLCAATRPRVGGCFLCSCCCGPTCTALLSPAS
jgi:hypothetical protein